MLSLFQDDLVGWVVAVKELSMNALHVFRVIMGGGFFARWHFFLLGVIMTRGTRVGMFRIQKWEEFSRGDWLGNKNQALHFLCGWRPRMKREVAMAHIRCSCKHEMSTENGNPVQ